MENPKYQKTAPPDRVALKAWNDIMAIARDNALIVMAAGGVAVLAVPQEQRKSGKRDVVLAAHLMNETGKE